MDALLDQLLEEIDMIMAGALLAAALILGYLEVVMQKKGVCE